MVLYQKDHALERLKSRVSGNGHSHVGKLFSEQEACFPENPTFASFAAKHCAMQMCGFVSAEWLMGVPRKAYFPPI